MKKLLFIMLLLVPVYSWAGYSHVAIVDPLSQDHERAGELDNYFRAPVGVTVAHHERHEGADFDVTVDTTGTSLILAWQLEDQSKQQHCTFKWKTENDGNLTFYKNPSWTTATGSTIIPNNVNDNSANNSKMQCDSSGSFVSNGICLNPTGLNVGSATIKWDESVYGTNQTPAGLGEGGRDENILLPGETYAFEITATSGGIWLHLDCYEHAPE